MEGFAADRYTDTPSNPTDRGDTSLPNPSLIPPVRRDTGGLTDDSIVMHKQDHHLVEEGNQLVIQGRKLLETIFGDKTDEYIRNVTGGRGTTAVADDPIDLPDLPDLPTITIDVSKMSDVTVLPDAYIDIHDAEARHDTDSEME